MFRLKKKERKKKKLPVRVRLTEIKRKKKQCEHQLRRNEVRQLAGKILTADMIDGSLGEKP